jgi:hypothetical protein
MEKFDAEAMMKSLLMIGDHLNKLDEFSKQISNREEEIRFRRHLGEIMGHVYIDLMLPIIKKFPDLDPDK